MINWILFVIGGFIAYIGISLFGQLTGGKDTPTPLSAALTVFDPRALIVLVLANLIFAVALYYRFKATPSALPVIIAIGVLTSFVYSVTVLNFNPNLLNLLGLAIIIVGIYRLSYTN